MYYGYVTCRVFFELILQIDGLLQKICWFIYMKVCVCGTDPVSENCSSLTAVAAASSPEYQRIEDQTSRKTYTRTEFLVQVLSSKDTEA